MPSHASVNKSGKDCSLLCSSKERDCNSVCEDAVDRAFLGEEGGQTARSKTDNEPGLKSMGVDAKEERFESDEVCFQTSSERYELWHQRLGHLSPQIMKQSLEAVSGVDLKPIDCNHGIRCVCASCRISKASTLKFSKMPRKSCLLYTSPSPRDA